MLVARLGVVRSEADHHKDETDQRRRSRADETREIAPRSMGSRRPKKKPNTRASQRQKPICATALVHLADLNLGNTPLWLLARA
jgi:hypothetical protein